MKLRRTSTDSSLPGRDGAFWLGGGEKTADAHARTSKQNIHTIRKHTCLYVAHV